MIAGLVAQLWIAVFWLLTLPLRLLFRFKGIARGSYLFIEVDGKVVDFVGRPRIWEIPGLQTTVALDWLDKVIDEVTKDARIRGVVVVIKSFEGGMAIARSFRDALARVRATGREVVVHLPQGGGTKEAYIASAADRVFLAPQATLAPVGFLVAARFFRRALDKLGIVPEVYAAGRFKSAGERIARESMSEANREQTDAILDALEGEVDDALAKGRHVDAARARAIIDGAPYRGEAARDVGLVDGVGYEDELPALMASGPLAEDGPATPFIIDARKYLPARRALAMRVALPRPVIGVITVHGMIAGKLPAWAGSGMAIDERVISAVRAARANPRVLGVVLHVDSPGGSALASDRIHHELVQLALEKPLVAYFSDVAASGGYYVAAAAHAIVAQPTTITGSIGVVAARIVVQPFLERLGIGMEVMRRGAHAALLEPTLPFDDETRAVIEREIQGTYRAFVDIVARGRRRSFEEIAKVAEGRVWMGKDALTHGLVDVLGGFPAAVSQVRERAGKGAARAAPVLIRGKRKSLPLNPPRAARAEATAALASLAARAGLDLPLLALATDPRQAVLAWSPAAATLRGR